MKLYLLAVILASTAGIEAAANCHWGPSYWCQSVETAQKCEQILYCKENVWKFKKLMNSNSPVGTVDCDVCLQAINYMQQELLKNSTEEAVLHALESFCSNRTDAGEACKRILGDYFDTVWNLLIGGLSPQDICTRIGLCADLLNRINKFYSHLLGRTYDEVECDNCKLAVKRRMSKYIRSSSMEMVTKKAWILACNQNDEVASFCLSSVDKEWSNIREIIQSTIAGDESGIKDNVESLKCQSCLKINYLIQKLLEQNIAVYSNQLSEKTN